MAPIVGMYQHERNENIDEYFKDLGRIKIKNSRTNFIILFSNDIILK